MYPCSIILLPVCITRCSKVSCLLEFCITWLSNAALVGSSKWQMDTPTGPCLFMTSLLNAGMPPDVGLYDSSLLAPAEEFSQQWKAADRDRTGQTPTSASPDDMAGWPVDLKLTFVTKFAQLVADAPLHSAATRQIDHLYGLGKLLDPEVR